MNAILRLSPLLVLISLAVAAPAQNLVVNPGFETGDFTGWTVRSDPLFGLVDVVSYEPRSGSHAAYFGSYLVRDTIEQSIATVVGRSYTVSYYVRTRDGYRDADFTGRFGDASATTSGGSFDYTLFQFTTIAVSTSTLLSFTGRNNETSYHLDDVSVVAETLPAQAVPGPASGVAFGLAAAARLRRRKRA